MIPKKIHYCWFGKNPESDLMLKCIKSWEKHLPEYELILWNEDNFDIEMNLYVSEAYAKGKWAFVTDFVRLYAMYHHGGIYMDTDVEVLKNLDVFLEHRAFSGYENDVDIPTGIMASEQKHPWVKTLLDYYTDRHFILEGGVLDLTTNVKTISDLSRAFQFTPEKGYQVLREGVVIYPREYFCPKDWKTKEVRLTENSYTIHHFDGSWAVKDKWHVVIMKHLWSLMIMGGLDKTFRNSSIFQNVKKNTQ